jgi:hypothetical protein
MPAVSVVSGEEAAHIIAWIRQQQRIAGIELRIREGLASCNRVIPAASKPSRQF